MSKCKYTSIGGQALIEGIMMRGPQKTAMAVRKPDGDIDLSFVDYKPLKEKYKILERENIVPSSNYRDGQAYDFAFFIF